MQILSLNGLFLGCLFRAFCQGLAGRKTFGPIFHPPCKTRIESLRATGAYAESGGTSFPFELVMAQNPVPWARRARADLSES